MGCMYCTFLYSVHIVLGNCTCLCFPSAVLLECRDEYRYTADNVFGGHIRWLPLLTISVAKVCFTDIKLSKRVSM